jgi:hypothetical protein
MFEDAENPAETGIEIVTIPSNEAEQKQPTPAEAKPPAPLGAVSRYLDGFHFYSGQRSEQVEAHHYVTVLDEGLMQAMIFDGNGPDAKLIGVEYIIDAERFAGLPEPEKLLWHSHGYEVKSGLLIAPGLDEESEHALMEQLVHSYGKTWHTWHGSHDSDIPLGIPALMMAFTAPGQIDEGLVHDRDQRFGVDTHAIAARRKDIPTPITDPLADAWEQGEVIVLEAVQHVAEPDHAEPDHADLEQAPDEHGIERSLPDLQR